MTRSPLDRWLDKHPDVLLSTIALYVGVHRVTVCYWRCGRYVPCADHQAGLHSFTRAYGRSDAITPAMWMQYARPRRMRSAA